MFLVAGLGNPGKKYENTRHNIGFTAVDKISANFEFALFILEKTFNSEISKGIIAGEKIILAKPQTFMNLSGRSISKISKFYKINYQDVIIIHDDIDLPLGKIKIVENRGAGGHKGVESIIKEIGTKKFIRFRIGIKPNEKLKIKSVKQLEKFVLKSFIKEEKKIVEQAIKKISEAVEFLLKNGLEKTQNRYNE